MEDDARVNDSVVWLKNELFDAVMRGENRGGRSTIVKLEDDGSVRVYALQVGLDDDGNERIELVDSGGVHLVRDYPGYIQLDPTLLTNAEADLVNPVALGWSDVATAAADTYAIEFNAIAIDSSNNVWLTIGIDVGGGGALGNAEYIHNLLNIPRRGRTGWCGPYVMAGDDVVRGNAAANNDIVVHWRIKQIDIGA